MKIARGVLLTILAASFASACVLFNDIDGFSNGGDHPDAAEAATTTDSPIDAGIDTLAPLSDASFDAPPDAPMFRDEFARADSPDLGNGWTEKTPDVFSLAGGVVIKGQSPPHYRDNLVTRPPEEDRADVEVSAVFTLAAVNGFPQVFARTQRTSLNGEASFDGYILFIDSFTSARLARQRGDAEEVALQVINLPAPLTGGSRVKLTLRVYDESPTVLEALVDRIEGSGTTRIGETKISDGAADRIDSPGATGFTASFEAIAAVDDFEWRALGTR